MENIGSVHRYRSGVRNVYLMIVEVISQKFFISKVYLTTILYYAKGGLTMAKKKGTKLEDKLSIKMESSWLKITKKQEREIFDFSEIKSLSSFIPKGIENFISLAPLP